MVATTEEAAFTTSPLASGFEVDLGGLLSSAPGSQAVTSHARIANLPQDLSTLTVKAKGAYVFAYVNSVLVGACWDVTSECEFYLRLAGDGRTIQGSSSGYFSNVAKPFLMPKTTVNLDVFIARPDGASVQPDEHLSIESTWDFGCSEECAQQGGSCRNGVCQCGGQGYGRHCSVQSDDMCYYLVSDIDAADGSKRYQIAPIDIEADFSPDTTFADIYGHSSSLSHSGWERHRSVLVALLKKEGELGLMSVLDTLNPRTEPSRQLKWGFAVRQLYSVLGAQDMLDLSGKLWTGREEEGAMPTDHTNPLHANSLWRWTSDTAYPGILDDPDNFDTLAWWAGHDGGYAETDGFTATMVWSSAKSDGVLIPRIPIPHSSPLGNGSYERLVIDITLEPLTPVTEELLEFAYVLTYDGDGGYQHVQVPMRAMEKATIEVHKCCARNITHESFVGALSDPGFVGEYANNKECITEISPKGLVEPAYLYTVLDEVSLGTGDTLALHTRPSLASGDTCYVYDLAGGVRTQECALDASVEGEGVKMRFVYGTTSAYMRFFADSSSPGAGYSGRYAILPSLRTGNDELVLPGAGSCFSMDGESLVKFEAWNFAPTQPGIGCMWNNDENLFTVASAVEGEPNWFTCPVPSASSFPGAEAYSSIALHLTSGLRGGVSPTSLTVPLCSAVDFSISSLVTTSNKDRFVAGVDPVQVVGRLRSAGGFLLSGDLPDITSVFSNVTLSSQLRVRLCCGATAAERDCMASDSGSLVLPSQEVLTSVFDEVAGGFLFPSFDVSAVTAGTQCTAYAAHLNLATYGGKSSGFDMTFVSDASATVPKNITMSWNFDESAAALVNTPAGICTEYGLSVPSEQCWPTIPEDLYPGVDLKVFYTDDSTATNVPVMLNWSCSLMDGSAVPGTFLFPDIPLTLPGTARQIPRPYIVDDVLCKLVGTAVVDGTTIEGETQMGALIDVKKRAGSTLAVITAEWANGAWSAPRNSLACYDEDAQLSIAGIFDNGTVVLPSFAEFTVEFTCSDGVTVPPMANVPASVPASGTYTILPFQGLTMCTATVAHAPSALSVTTKSMYFVPLLTALPISYNAASITTHSAEDYLITSTLAVTVSGVLSTGDPFPLLDTVEAQWACEDGVGSAYTVTSPSGAFSGGSVTLTHPALAEITDFVSNTVNCRVRASVQNYDATTFESFGPWIRIVPAVAVTGLVAIDPSELTDVSGTIYHNTGEMASLTVSASTAWGAASDLTALTAYWACERSDGSLLTTDGHTEAPAADGTLLMPYPVITDNASGPFVSTPKCTVVVASAVPGGDSVLFESLAAAYVPRTLMEGTASFADSDLTDFEGVPYHTNGTWADVAVSGTNFFGDDAPMTGASGKWLCRATNLTEFTVIAPGPAPVASDGALTLKYPTIVDNPLGPIETTVLCRVVVTVLVAGGPSIELETQEVRILPNVVAEFDISLAPTLYQLAPREWSVGNVTTADGSSLALHDSDGVSAVFSCYGVVSPVISDDGVPSPIYYPRVNATGEAECVLTVGISYSGYTTYKNQSVTAVPLADVSSVVSDTLVVGLVYPQHMHGHYLYTTTTIVYSDGTLAQVRSGARVCLQCRHDELAAFEDKATKGAGTITPVKFNYPVLAEPSQCRLVTRHPLLASEHLSPVFEIVPAAVQSIDLDVAQEPDNNGDGIPDIVPSLVNVTISGKKKDGVLLNSDDVGPASVYEWFCCPLNTTSALATPECFSDGDKTSLGSGLLFRIGEGTVPAPAVSSISLCDLVTSISLADNPEAASANSSASVIIFYIPPEPAASMAGTVTSYALVIFIGILVVAALWLREKLLRQKRSVLNIGSLSPSPVLPEAVVTPRELVVEDDPLDFQSQSDEL